MITKKNVLVVSGMLSFLWFFILFVVGTDVVCGGKEFVSCGQGLDILFETTLIIIPFSLCSLVVYFLRDQVFQTWIKFAFAWVPLTILAVLISPEYGSVFLPIVKGTVSFIMSLIFLLVSVVIIFFRFIQTRRK